MILEIVVPCYNEQEVLPETSTRLVNLLTRLIDQGKISEQSKIYFIDDGSTDQTWTFIRSMAQDNPLISGIKLSKNCGHQHALLAGLFTATGDAVISIDADLQDDVNVIEEMLGEFEKGHDIVYGIRKNRMQDTLIKRYSAESYYKFLLALGVRVVFNHADFRLLSRRALENLKEFKEVNLFLRGLIPLLGFPSSVVYYNRENRVAGTSKYPIRKMFGLALDGITSFSIGPLRFITALGFFIFFLSLLGSFWILFIRFFTEQAVPGWASTVLPIYFIGGIQILCLGIIGEYLGKIYTETKKRPRYIIEEIV